MNRLRTIAIALALSALMGPSVAQASRAGDYCAASGWKLAHGLMSIPYSTVDLVTTPVSMAMDWDSDGRSATGFGLGLVLGLVNAHFRSAVGVAEVMTFPFVSAYTPRPFKLEPYVFGWSPILGHDHLFPDLSIDAAPKPPKKPVLSGD